MSAKLRKLSGSVCTYDRVNAKYVSRHLWTQCNLHMLSLILCHGVLGLSDSDNKQHVAEAPFHTSAVDLLLVSAACIFASHPYAV